MYKGLLTGDPNVADLLITALEESAVDETTDDEDFAYLVYDVSLPYATIAAILDNDHEAFVQAVVESNESHFEYYNSSKQKQGNAPALINWKTAGMVQVAVDSGFPRPPSNPYLPEFELQTQTPRCSLECRACGYKSVSYTHLTLPTTPYV